MKNVVVVGSQWGDEGKGKIVDWLSDQADVVIRFQGGHNAGHTLVIDGITYKLRLLPSGVVRKNKISIIGNGVVVDPWALLEEIKEIKSKGVEINPNDSYVLNYLAYSWLERDYKIDTAIEMLQRAYKQNENDPFIIDSVGWGYYLVDDLVKAEQFLKKAIELMPNDPIVNDHYGDVLWKMDRKIEAKYYWQSVLKFEDTEESMKEKIKIKLLKGLKKI